MSAVNGENDATSVVSLRMPAKPEYIVLGRLALTGILRTRAIGSEVIADLKLALTEACTNSIRHAYADGRDGMVEIRYELEHERLSVEVIDEGGGFDPELLRADPSDLEEGGLGIAIIQAVTDGLDIRPRDGTHGSRLRFLKYLN